MDAAARLNVVELTVSELSQSLKRTVEDAFGHVRLRGEISGYRGPHSSGHCYFALKDESARIDAVIWKGVYGKMRVKPEEGLEVVVTGRVTTYPGRSNYQIVVETLEPAGVGALMALLEERKKKLAKEGLFDEARKQLIPFLPQVIGVITSPTGAVIRDILHRLNDRFARHVIVWPVRVQGETSAAEVAAAIEGFNAFPVEGPMRRPDLLIVARGGGSLEDLWSFNEEIVVRAAAGSMIPLISAVGHETDITLIDFASDRRAPTPTAAAEMAVPVRTDLLTQVAALHARRVACWQRGIELRRKELRALERALPRRERLFEQQRQRLDGLAERLPRALAANAQVHHRQFDRLKAQLSPQMLRRRIDLNRERVAGFGDRGERSIRVLVGRRRELMTRTNFSPRAARAFLVCQERRGARLGHLGELLKAFSYRGVLDRGFALVRGADGHPLRGAAQVESGARLAIEFADGTVSAVADGAAVMSKPASKPHAKTSVPKASAPKAKPPGPSGQGDLF
ncbi:MAG: exodeoxyribonuclease VII large subunit [Pseudolabrys sp.]|nr:exodeoxyribonuclease VII large subunit [Pseudolabrys sp.]